ncbi:MAG: hypothetical protein U1E63_11330 [Burkholderiales bacterium]
MFTPRRADHRGSGNGLAECGRGTKHAHIVTKHRGNGRLLISPKRPDESHINRLAGIALVPEITADGILAQQLLRGIEAAARKGNVAGIVFGAADHPGLVPHRQPHGLCPVELGVLKRRESDQAVGQWLRKFRLLKIDEVRQCHDERLRHHALHLHGRCRRAFPRCRQTLIVDKGHVEGMHAACGPNNRRLDVVRRHRLNRRQELPLVRVRPQIGVDKHSEPVLPRLLLQRQGDQIAEAALGQGVLIGKQAVVGRELQLPGARAGVADDGSAHPTRIPGRYTLGEEDPGVRPVSRAGSLDCNRDAEIGARTGEGSNILSPLGIVEIDREEVAVVVLQQRIDTDRVVTGQVGVDGSVRERDQRAIPTVSALDSGLLAHSSAPLVRTGRCVTRLAGRLALPTHGVDIRATPKPPAKECHFRLGGESRRFGLRRRSCRFRRETPLDSVCLQERDQSLVLRLQHAQGFGLRRRSLARR